MAYFNNTKDFLIALKGDKGDSPQITAERVTGGVKLTITNPDGTGYIQTIYDGTGGGGSSHGDVDNIKYKSTSSDGLIDNYTIQFEDGYSYDFQLYNGGKGGGGNIVIDKTLTQSDKAADAKAVGDRIKEIDDVIVDMASGGTGYVQNVQTFDGEKIFKFFVGEQSEYEALPSEQKDDLFAIITNDTTQTDLLTAVDGLVSGNVLANKATNDSKGNNIYNTYVRKSTRNAKVYKNINKVIKTGVENGVDLVSVMGADTVSAIAGVTMEVWIDLTNVPAAYAPTEKIIFSAVRHPCASDVDESGIQTLPLYFTAVPSVPKGVYTDGNNTVFTQQSAVIEAYLKHEVDTNNLYIIFEDGAYSGVVFYMESNDSVKSIDDVTFNLSSGKFTLKNLSYWLG